MAEDKNTQKSAQQVINEKAREIWLAGLGIFSTIEEEGSKAFNNFMEKGKDLEAKGEAFEERAKASVQNLPSLESVGKFVEEKVTIAFDKLGLSSQKEAEDLNAKVDKLTETVEALVKKMEANAKAASKSK